MNLTSFKLIGRAHSAKINNMIKNGFSPRNIVIKGKTLTFDELSSNESSIVAFFNELCYDYTIINRRGIKHTIFNIIANKGLFIGIIISIALLIMCSMLIFDIDILGTERTDINEISKAVEDSGVKRFGLIYTVDKKTLSNKILEIEGISSVSIETRGVKVYINIEEELPKADINDIDTVTPVLSEYDSIITRVVTLSGTALVKKGDTVLKGKTLIAPYMIKTIGDEEHQEERVPSEASGIIYGKVWYRESITIAKEQIIRRRTGDFIQITTPSYILGGGSNPVIPYLLYEKEENKYTYNAVFPLIVTYTKYYELEEVTISRIIGNDYNEFISESYLKQRGALPSDAIVLRYWSNIKEVDNVTIIDVYLETEQRIDDGG